MTPTCAALVNPLLPVVFASAKLSHRNQLCCGHRCGSSGFCSATGTSTAAVSPAAPKPRPGLLLAACPLRRLPPGSEPVGLSQETGAQSVKM